MMTSLFTMKGLIGFSDRYKLICPTLRSMQLAPEVIVRTIRSGVNVELHMGRTLPLPQSLAITFGGYFS